MYSTISGDGNRNIKSGGPSVVLPIHIVLPLAQPSRDQLHVVVQSEDRAYQQEGLRHIYLQSVRHVVDCHHLVSHECNAAHNQQHCTSVLRDNKALFHTNNPLNPFNPCSPLTHHVRRTTACQARQDELNELPNNVFSLVTHNASYFFYTNYQRHDKGLVPVTKEGCLHKGGSSLCITPSAILSPQHLVILVLAGDVAEGTWISIGLSACTQNLRHLDVIHLHLWFLIIFFHNDLILRTLSPKGSPPIQGDLEGLLFDNYLLTIINIHTLY